MQAHLVQTNPLEVQAPGLQFLSDFNRPIKSAFALGSHKGNRKPQSRLKKSLLWQSLNCLLQVGKEIRKNVRCRMNPVSSRVWLSPGSSSLLAC